MEASKRAALIVLSLYIAVAMSCSYCCAQEIGDSCQFLYTRQPPDFLPCNPYLNRELRLECTVVSPLPTTLNVNFAWFYSPKAPNPLSKCYARELQNLNRKISILRQSTLSNDRRTLRSQLRVLNLTDLDSGTYWCMAQTNGLQQLLPSDPVFLEQAAFYEEAGLPPCSTRSAVSKEENRCAVIPASLLPQITPSCPISTPTLQPSNSPSAPLLQLTASLLQPTTSSSSTPQPVTSVILPASSEVLPRSPAMPTSSELRNDLPSTTTTVSSIAANLNQLSTSIGLLPSAVSPEITTPSNTNTDPSEVPGMDSHTPSSSAPPFPPQLYIGIGVVVLLAVTITVLLSVFICLCFRSHRLKGCSVDRHLESNAYSTSGRARSCSSTPLQHHSRHSSIHSNSTRSTQTINGSLLLNVHYRVQSESSNGIIPVCHNLEANNSIDHSYETVLSNEYEDVIEVQENRAYTSSPVHVKRNLAYRAFTLDDEESEAVAAASEERQESVAIQRPQDYVIPHPTLSKLSS